MVPIGVFVPNRHAYQEKSSMHPVGNPKWLGQPVGGNVVTVNPAAVGVDRESRIIIVG